MKQETFKSGPYQYIKIHNYYFCLQQNPVVLAFILFFKQDYLISIFRPWYKKSSLHGIAHYIKSFYNFLFNNIKVLVVFIQHQIKLKNTQSTIELPVYGQLCLPVHKGYKIFNLFNKTVAKVYDSNIESNKILHEIEQLKIASQIDFAPSLKECNLENHCYVENYFSDTKGYAFRSQDQEALINRSFNDLVPHLTSLIFFQRCINRNALEYAVEITSHIEDAILSGNNLSNNENSRILTFIHSIVKKLNCEKNPSVHLAFSHGDFCPANMLNTNDGIKVVDWESTKHRSLLFDFYSYFFYLPTNRKFPVSKLFYVIKNKLPVLISGISSENQAISNTITAFENTYRWLYYIERISMLVERNMTDTNLNIAKYIFEYIDAFNGYEDFSTVNIDSGPTVLNMGTSH